ncbi:MAG: alkyl hydroperoxide reductase [Ignavibacteria bacterium]|nr:MAG: alkyl hydroperoxide reductase [Ignavibacteria bacterium]KAF0156404.1 MAG: alkyl hydroperoxide reductase [Ignavibacteria bacterium]
MNTDKNKKLPGLTKQMRGRIYTGVFFAVIILLFVFNNADYLFGGEEPNGPYPPSYVPTGEQKSVQAPDFELPTSDGKKLKFSSLKGKVVIVDFWATWCPPCRKGVPDLVELKKKYGKKGFEIVGISLDGPQTKGDVVPFIKEYGINYPVVYGNQAVTVSYGGVQSIPTAFIIDKQGKIVATYVGLKPIEVYEEHIKKLL